MNLVFPSLTDVLALHAESVKRHGGADGIRDFNLLESALAQPMASFGEQFLHGDQSFMAVKGADRHDPSSAG
jgi:death-on-curing protein